MDLRPLEEKKTNKIAAYIRKHPLVIIFVGAIVLIILAVIISLSGNGGSGGEQATSSKAADNSTLVETSTIDLPMYKLTSLNPLSSGDEDTYQIAQLVCSSLFTLDSDLNIEGDAAKSYETDASSGTVTVTLQDGIRFSDGTTLDADDVKFTVKQIMDIGESSPYYVYASRIGSVSGSGSTVTIQFTSPSDAAVDNLVFPIVSSSSYSQEDTDKMVGSGPYKISSVSSDLSEITLTANENYYGTKPSNKIHFEQTMYDGNRMGFVSSDSATACVITDNPNVKEDAADLGLKCFTFRSSECEFLGFQCSGTFTKKKRVRRAVCLALDTKRLAKDCYGSNTIQSDSIYFPGFLGTKNSGDAYPTDTNEAMRLLKKAGFEDRDGDGVLEDQKGRDLELTLLVNADNSERTDCAQEIRDSLSNIGISVQIDEKSGEEYQTAVNSGQFDILLTGRRFDKQYNLKDLFDKDGVFHYNNKVVMNESAKLETALNADEQRDAFETLKADLNDDAVFYCICYRKYALVTSSTFKKEEGPVFFCYYRGISSWSWKRVSTPDTASDTYE